MRGQRPELRKGRTAWVPKASMREKEARHRKLQKPPRVRARLFQVHSLAGWDTRKLEGASPELVWG